MKAGVKFACFGGKSHGNLNFSREKTTTKPSLFDYILLFTVGWRKKEIASARDKKQKRQIALKEKHIYFIAEVRK